jgi:hypothetical protein
MTEQVSTLNRHDIEAKILKHCWKTEEFRREFVTAPKAAFVKCLQLPAESLPKIVVHEEQQGTWHIVLPPKPVNVRELSDADLEKVAGGGDQFPTWTVITSWHSITTVTSKDGW